MLNKDWNSMSEQEFEMMLRDSISELPPDNKIVEDVTPWYRAMNRVVLGIAYTTIRINVLWLDFLLPAIGYVFCLLGFRALRKENVWFRVGWILSIYRCIFFYSGLTLDATIYSDIVGATRWMYRLNQWNLIIQFVIAVCIWRGCQAVQKKAGVPKNVKGAIALVVFMAIIYWLGTLNVQFRGWIFLIIWVASYVGIIKSLFAIVNELDKAGYMIETAPVRVSDGVLTKAILGLTVVGFICGYTFFNKYPMEWTKFEEADGAQVEEIKEDLLKMGFPEDILRDLTAEEILACENARCVKVEEGYESIGKPTEVRVDTTISSYIKMEYPEEVRMTIVGVMLEEEPERWRVFHHIEFVKDVQFYGTEVIRHKIGDYRGNYRGWTNLREYSGRVLYEKDGQLYSAPYYSMDEGDATSGDILGLYTSTERYMYATFSMPKDGKHQRAYISYEVEQTTSDSPLYSEICYWHQEGWWQYPVKSAKEYSISGSWNKLYKVLWDYTHFWESKAD